MKNTKEFENVLDAIGKWVEKHKGNVHFVGSFMAFKGKNFDVVDDRLFAYGDKNLIRENLKEIDTMVEKEKEEFVNW